MDLTSDNNALEAAAPAVSVTEATYQRIRRDLLSCSIVPGDRLTAAALCERLEVGPGAVREALARLHSEGLVIGEPQRGYRAAPLSRHELTELSEARVAIEGICLRNSMEGADLAWEQRLVSAWHALTRIPLIDGDGPGLSPTWLGAHVAFHEVLISNCTNGVMKDFRMLLFARSERYRGISTHMAPRDHLGEHRVMFDAALARDVELAVGLMSDHIRATTAILLAGLDRIERDRAVERPRRRRSA